VLAYSLQMKASHRVVAIAAIQQNRLQIPAVQEIGKNQPTTLLITSMPRLLAGLPQEVLDGILAIAVGAELRMGNTPMHTLWQGLWDAFGSLCHVTPPKPTRIEQASLDMWQGFSERWQCAVQRAFSVGPHLPQLPSADIVARAGAQLPDGCRALATCVAGRKICRLVAGPQGYKLCIGSVHRIERVVGLTVSPTFAAVGAIRNGEVAISNDLKTMLVMHPSIATLWLFRAGDSWTGRPVHRPAGALPPRGVAMRVGRQVAVIVTESECTVVRFTGDCHCIDTITPPRGDTAFSMPCIVAEDNSGGCAIAILCTDRSVCLTYPARDVVKVGRLCGCRSPVQRIGPKRIQTDHGGPLWSQVAVAAEALGGGCHVAVRSRSVAVVNSELVSHTVFRTVSPLTRITAACRVGADHLALSLVAWIDGGRVSSLVIIRLSNGTTLLHYPVEWDVPDSMAEIDDGVFAPGRPAWHNHSAYQVALNRLWGPATDAAITARGQPGLLGSYSHWARRHCRVQFLGGLPLPIRTRFHGGVARMAHAISTMTQGQRVSVWTAIVGAAGVRERPRLEGHPPRERLLVMALLLAVSRFHGPDWQLS